VRKKKGRGEKGRNGMIFEEEKKEEGEGQEVDRRAANTIRAKTREGEQRVITANNH
jgi:hypothetical protein